MQSQHRGGPPRRAPPPSPSVSSWPRGAIILADKIRRAASSQWCRKRPSSTIRPTRRTITSDTRDVSLPPRSLGRARRAGQAGKGEAVPAACSLSEDVYGPITMSPVRPRRHATLDSADPMAIRPTSERPRRGQPHRFKYFLAPAALPVFIHALRSRAGYPEYAEFELLLTKHKPLLFELYAMICSKHCSHSW